ncbi:MAG TPA: DUF711 family protein [Ktedonobacterales bacterium]|nr:DUF711 family protein [Ktedonobacterales bacterium]
MRTMTLGVGALHPLAAETFDLIGPVLAMAQAEFERAGYEVQSARIALRPVFIDLAEWSARELLEYCGYLQQLCQAHQISYCSIGHIPANAPDADLRRISLLSDVLTMNPALSASVQIASTGVGLRVDAALPAARVICDLARQTNEGLGNLFFAVTANCPPQTPFFPVAYHDSPDWGFSIGLQSAGLVGDTLRAVVQERGSGLAALRDGAATARLIGVLEEVGRPIADMCAAWREHDITYYGLDLSPAPYGEESIADAIEQAGLGHFGEAGTTAVAAAITAALKGTSLRTCGYCGLMLPPVYDAVISERLAEGRLTLDSLLLYSAICGSGPDCIPIPGDIAPERIAHLLLDVGALAARLRKPLAAKLLPILGKQAGEMTTFSSPYLVNAPILRV